MGRERLGERTMVDWKQIDIFTNYDAKHTTYSLLPSQNLFFSAKIRKFQYIKITENLKKKQIKMLVQI